MPNKGSVDPSKHNIYWWKLVIVSHHKILDGTKQFDSVNLKEVIYILNIKLLHPILIVLVVPKSTKHCAMVSVWLSFFLVGI